MEKSLGKGGTGGTEASSVASASSAARSLEEAASPEYTETSLLALFLLVLLIDCLPETDVAFVVIDSAAESRELFVGVLVVPDEAELRFRVKLMRVCIEPAFF